MDTNTAADLGLISPFGTHYTSLPKNGLGTAVFCANRQTRLRKPVCLAISATHRCIRTKSNAELYLNAPEWSKELTESEPGRPAVGSKQLRQLRSPFGVGDGQHFVTSFEHGCAARNDHLTMPNDGGNYAMFG